MNWYRKAILQYEDAIKILDDDPVERSGILMQCEVGMDGYIWTRAVKTVGEIPKDSVIERPYRNRTYKKDTPPPQTLKIDLSRDRGIMIDYLWQLNRYESNVEKEPNRIIQPKEVMTNKVNAILEELQSQNKIKIIGWHRSSYYRAVRFIAYRDGIRAGLPPIPSNILAPIRDENEERTKAKKMTFPKSDGDDGGDPKKPKPIRPPPEPPRPPQSPPAHKIVAPPLGTRQRVLANWYRNSQSMELNQSLEPEEFLDESVFTETRKAIDLLGMERFLDPIATRSLYKSIPDYLLCSLYPEYGKPCQNFYDGNGPKLIDTMKPNQIRKIDVVLAQAVLHLYKLKQQGRL